MYLFQRLCIALASSVLLAQVGSGPVNVRGNVFLSDGDTPGNPIRFSLVSGDGMLNDVRFTDSNGRFILERLSPNINYTLTFLGDGASYGDTTFTLRPDADSTPRITLNPPVKRKVPSGATISAASGYKPDAQAVAIYDKAMKAIGDKHYDVAEPLLRQATSADPKYTMAWNALGALLMQEKKYGQAEKPLRQALESDPKFITALLNLGIVLNHLGRYADAVAPLREALRLQPELPAAHEHLGIALVETDQFPEAEQELKKALGAADPDEIVLQLYLGKLYARTGEFQKSIDSFTIYLQKAPNSPNAAEVRGIMDRLKREMATRR